MDHSNFPEGCEVHQSALSNVETSKIFHIQRRFIDSFLKPGTPAAGTQSARMTGLDISIGAPTSRFTITPGYGYTPRGDYVEITAVGATAVANFALADYTTGVRNYVCLAYREVPGSPAAHESSGLFLNTIVTRSAQLIVYSSTAFLGLPANTDSDLQTNLNNADLTTDAQDRLCVLAIVVGKGSPGGIPTGYVAGDFTNGNILQQGHFVRQVTASPPATILITGLNLKSFSGDTLPGSAILQLNGSPTQWRLSYSSPDANGNSVNPSGLLGVTFTPSSNVQTLTISSETPTLTANTITVEVLTDLMPQSGTPFVDIYSVSAFYENSGGQFSLVDNLHRSKLGSYVPTAVDPHGMGYSDFAQQVAVIPQPALLGGNALATNAQAIQARISTPRSTVGGVLRTLMWQMTAGNYNIRFYKTNADQLEITANARWDGANWNFDQVLSGVLASKFQIGANGLSEFTYTAAVTPFADALFVQTWASDSFNFASPRQGMLRLGMGFLLGTDRINPRVRAPFNGRVLMWESTNLSGGPIAGCRIYALADQLELVINGYWDNTNWNQDNPAVATVRYAFTDGTFFTSSKGAGGGSWSDTGWDDNTTPNFQYDPRSGLFAVLGNINSGGTLIAQTLAPTNSQVPALQRSVTPTAGNPRFLVEDIIDTTHNIHYRKYVSFPNGSPYGLVEHTMNCRWTGSAWDYDSFAFGAATLWRSGYPSTLVVTKNGGGPHPWNDLPDPIVPPGQIGGFDRFEYMFTHGGAGGLYLPNTPGAPNQNTIYGQSTAKAWGIFTLTDSHTGALTLLDSYNVASIPQPNSANLQVNLSTNMGTSPPAYYVVNCQLLSVPANNGSNAIVEVRSASQNVSNFILNIIRRDGQVMSWSNFDNSNNNMVVGFTVFGRQGT